MKTVYLFDLDGTLTEPKEGITKSVRYALNKLGIDAELDELEKFIGPPLKYSFSEFYGLDDETCLEAVRYYRERYSDKGLFENRIFDGVIPLLKGLKKQGKKTAVATCKPEVFARQVCDKYGMTPYLDEICGTDLDGILVTKAQVIEETLSRLNENPDDAVMVGDRKFDIEGAKHFSMKSVGVTIGYAADGELEEAGADYIIDDLQSLLDMEID